MLQNIQAVCRMVWDVEHACSMWLFRAVGPYCVDSAHWLRDDRPEGLQALYEHKTQLPWRAACWPVLVCVAPLALLHTVYKLLACVRSVAWVLIYFLTSKQALQEKYQSCSDEALALEQYEYLPDCVAKAKSLRTTLVVFVPALQLEGHTYYFCVVSVKDGVALVRARADVSHADVSHDSSLLPDHIHVEQLRPWRVYHRDGRYMDRDWREVFTVSRTQQGDREWILVQKPPPSRWHAAWQSIMARVLFFPSDWLEHVGGNLPPHGWYRVPVAVLVRLIVELLFYVWQVPITAAFLALRVVCQLLCRGWQGCETPKGLCPWGHFWFQGLKYLLAPVLLSARCAFTLAVITACIPLWAVGWCGSKLGSRAAACVSFFRNSNVGDRAAASHQETEVPVAP